MTAHRDGAPSPEPASGDDAGAGSVPGHEGTAGPGPSGTVAATPRTSVQAVVLLLLVLSLAAGIVGNAFLPALLRTSPKLLLVVQSSYAQMALATTRLDPVTLLVIAALRRWIGESLAFAAGRVLGPRALSHLRGLSSRPLRLPRFEGRSWILRDVLIVVFPQPVLSAVFGILPTPTRRFLLLKLLGSFLTVAAYLAVLAAVPLPLAAVADVMEANVAVLSMFGVLGVAGWLWWRHRSAPRRAPGAGEGDGRSESTGDAV